MIEIKCIAGHTIFTADVASQKEAIELAIAEKVSLDGINFMEWDFEDADLNNKEYSKELGIKLKLDKVKNYRNSWTILLERLRKAGGFEFLTGDEWAAIGFSLSKSICWRTITERFPEQFESIFKKLADIGYKEYIKKFYKEINGG